MTRRLPLAVLAALLLLPVLAPKARAADVAREFAGQQMSVMIGPSPWGWNLVGVKKDLVREKETTLFVTAGLGTILVGGGAAYHPNGRNAEGPIFSAVVGVLGGHLGASYQWMLNTTDSIHFGLHVGAGWAWDHPLMPIVAWERRL